MDKQLSNQIKNCSLLLMIMVVFLHSYNIDIKQAGKVLFFAKDSNWFIQNFISYGITRIAVPLFFLISGYLFITKATFSFIDYKTKISKRVTTLLIPYLFWALFGLFFYFILQTIPQSQGFFTKKLIKDYNFIEWMNAIFIEPIPYQLWFLKDLIVMVFLSPIIFFLVKQLKVVFLVVILVFWTSNQNSVFLTSEALLFFSSGIYIRYFDSEIISKQIKKSSLIFFFWILIIAVKTVMGFYNYSQIGQQLLLKFSIIIGIVAFWSQLDTKRYNKYIDLQISKIAPFSFFIFVFHEPFLNIIKKALFSQLPKTPSSYFMVYIVAPIIVIMISIFIAMFLRRRLFYFYKIITGNR